MLSSKMWLLAVGAIVILSVPVGADDAQGASEAIMVSSESQTWRMNTGDTARDLQLDSRCIEFRHPSGASNKLEVVGVYDSSSGVFWWRYRGIRDFEDCPALDAFRRDHAFYVDDRAIIGVELYPAGPVAHIWGAQRQFNTVEQGWSATMRLIQENGGEFFRGSPKHVKRLKLSKYVGLKFVIDSHTGASAIESVELARASGGWSMLLRRGDGRSATMFLDGEFNVVDVGDIHN